MCTEGRNRTGTDVKCPRDFKSLVSTNFTTSATEASTRFELVHNGFADRSLTAWVRRRKNRPHKEALSERWDSNPRPSRWQRDALPAELLSQILLIDKVFYMVEVLQYLLHWELALEL